MGLGKYNHEFAGGSTDGGGGVGGEEDQRKVAVAELPVAKNVQRRSAGHA